MEILSSYNLSGSLRNQGKNLDKKEKKSIQIVPDGIDCTSVDDTFYRALRIKESIFKNRILGSSNSYPNTVCVCDV
jgi:hypothetical protein